MTAISLARETGETFVADETGALCRLDRTGRIVALTRLHDPIRKLAWSDDGSAGVALCGEGTVHYFDHTFTSQWKLEIPEPALEVAIAPYGTHVAICAASGENRIYDAGKAKVSRFETIRPLSFAQFVAAEPELIGCAEHGLLCRHRLYGEQLWTEKLWSNVGQLEMTGDGSLIYLASFGHGIQVFDAEGGNVGAYMLDGTVNRAAVSFEPQRVIASTVERSLYWLDPDGELMWATRVPDDVVALQCDPLGEWAICGFRCGRLYRLDWGGTRAAA